MPKEAEKTEDRKVSSVNVAVMASFVLLDENKDKAKKEKIIENKKN